MIIDGKRIATDAIELLKRLPRPDKFLVAIVARTDAATQSFIRQKERTAHDLGVDFRVHEMGSSSHTDGVASAVRAYVADPACGGIVVQLPLPPQVSRATILSEIPIEKDVDVIGNQAIRAFENKSARVLPPAVGTVRHIILSILGTPQEATPDEEDGAVSAWLSSRRVAVLGRGILVGQPVACWLDGKVVNLASIDVGDDHVPVHDADLVVCGTGQAGALKPDNLRPGAMVVDFGYGERDGAASGDFDALATDIIKARGISYTPTPGGTGPILVAQLFENFYALNR